VAMSKRILFLLPDILTKSWDKKIILNRPYVMRTRYVCMPRPHFCQTKHTFKKTLPGRVFESQMDEDVGSDGIFFHISELMTTCD
jgi:hypothetical protein